MVKGQFRQTGGANVNSCPACNSRVWITRDEPLSTIEMECEQCGELYTVNWSDLIADCEQCGANVIDAAFRRWRDDYNAAH